MSTIAPATTAWTARLLDQLSFHWDHHLRPRLDGLTDEEYRWEPVAGCVGLRPDADGILRAEWPDEGAPPPVTTIGWRLGHLLVGVLGQRNEHHFAGPPFGSARTYAYPVSAAVALDRLDAAYEWWSQGVRSLDADDLEVAVGPAEGPFAQHPYGELVLHIHREVIHHGAEILLLRDLYRCGGR